MAEVEISKIEKFYGKQRVIHGVDLHIPHNEFTVLVGPSGCGKSTVLRMIAGLEDINNGKIFISGKLVNHLPPRKRNVAMVFQNYALYPHMTVAENLGFALKIAKLSKDEITQRIQEAASILDLTELMSRRPAELSGGQRQRVAMGRAIVRHPDLFLFDEPLSNLDAKLRVQMRTEIKKLHQKVKTTIIYVTHDQVEAMTLADRIVLMEKGNVVQSGSPLELYEKPVNIFTATFLGSPPMNLIDCTVKEGNFIIDDNIKIPIPEKFKNINFPNHKIVLGIRSECINPKGDTLNGKNFFTFSNTISFVEPLGSETLIGMRVGSSEVQSKMFDFQLVQPGMKMEFVINLDKMHLFDAETQKNLSIINNE